MKTLQDLVDRLNTYWEPCFLIDDHGDYVLLKYGEDNSRVMTIYKQGGWKVSKRFGVFNPFIQHIIMDFVYSTNPNDWFPEKTTYNLFSGHNEDDKYFYMKNGAGQVVKSNIPYTKVPLSWITDNPEDYEFTAEEIQDIQFKFPGTSVKIVTSEKGNEDD